LHAGNDQFVSAGLKSSARDAQHAVAIAV
jgi:hypothetical protein